MKATDAEIRWVRALEAEHAAVYEFLKFSGQWQNDKAKAEQILAAADDIKPGTQAEAHHVGEILMAAYMAVGDARLAAEAERQQMSRGSLQA